MKIQVRVITRHSPANYGSLLQSIATQKILDKIGVESKIIDYIAKEETGSRIAFTQLKQKKGWNKNPLKKMAYILGREPENIVMYHHFTKMRKKYLLMTKQVNSHEELRKYFKNSKAVFMTGSDQVWGPVSTGTYDSAYFLDFVPKGNKKIAFASSFGKAKFNEKTMKEYKQYLVQYDKIAVREDKAVEILDDMGIESEQVLDPTLLIDKNEWSKYITKNVVKEEYVLVYQIHNDQKLNAYAKMFAKKSGLKLVRVSPIFHQFKRGGKFVYLPDIGEFLSLVKNAKYLITDSFHGTAFAININTQFIEVLPNTGTSSRNQSILELTGLQDRILKDLNDFRFIKDKIDFSRVNEVMDAHRESCVKCLKFMLKDEEI